MKRVLLLGIISLVGIACTDDKAIEPVVDGPATEVLEALGGETCPDSDFTCVTIEMPLDHFDDSNEEKIEVTFAVQPATGDSQGAFVTATGGPGTAGILYADSYASALDPAVTESYDIVFYDQRGVGMSGGLTCPEAATDLYSADANPSTAAGQDLLTTSASTFVTDCISEMGDPEILPFLSTAQVVEDLEVFRQMLGFDQFVLYGESYGTQVAQTYAAAHPENLDRLLLDGTVDLTLDHLAFYGEQATAFAQTLEATFDACIADTACTDDFGDDPGAAYDRLAGQLAEGPIEVDFPLPDGRAASREFSFVDLEVIASAQMYAEDDRMLFLRALAAESGRDDLIPLLRLLYPNLGLEPLDESIIEDPSWSDAIYYAVECQDYGFPGETPEDVVEDFFAAGAPYNEMRLGSIFYGDLPCAFWPDRNTDTDRPDPLEAEGVPTLVLGATADPATPYHQGAAVHGRLETGYLITQGGGPHIIFGRGNACPDEDTTAFILDGTPPPVSVCEGDVAESYLALMPASIGEFDSAEAMLDAIEWELSYLPEYYYWDGVEDTAAGCSQGGTVAFTPTDLGEEFQFEECGLAEGLVISGSGDYDADGDVFTLDITNGGPDCAYVYSRSGEEIDLDDRCPTDSFGA